MKPLIWLPVSRGHLHDQSPCLFAKLLWTATESTAGDALVKEQLSIEVTSSTTPRHQSIKSLERPLRVAGLPLNYFAILLPPVSIMLPPDGDLAEQKDEQEGINIRPFKQIPKPNKECCLPKSSATLLTARPTSRYLVFQFLKRLLRS